MDDKDEVRSTRSETSGHEGSTTTVAPSVQDRIRLLMDDHGFSPEEAEAALTPDPLIPRPGANQDKILSVKSSRGDSAGKAQHSPLAKVKTTHRRIAPGSGSRSPHPRTYNSLEDQHQGSPRTEERLFGSFVETKQNSPEATHLVPFKSPEPAASKTIETMSSNCDSCGGECVYSVPLQKATGFLSHKSRGDKAKGDKDIELAKAKAKRGGHITSGKAVTRTAKTDLDIAARTTTPAETGIKNSLPMRTSANVKFFEEPIAARHKRGRTVANHFPANPDVYRQHAPSRVAYISVLDPGPSSLDTPSQPLCNTASKTTRMPLTINFKPAEGPGTQFREPPRRTLSPTRSTRSSLAEAGSHNSKRSKPGSPPAFADEAISQVVNARKKEDIIKAMKLGTEWDVVANDEAGEEDWLAVDVDETTAKIKFMKIEAEKL